MIITEVNDKQSIKEFLKVNVLMNAGNPNYVQPLDNEVNDVFNPEKNKNFKYGTAKRWLLKSNDGKLLGRIAAFTNDKYINKGTEYKTGGVGYFDCINDKSAATLLFDTAKQWLISEGMEAMDGPINFGDRDRNWGLLVEGFEKAPMYGIAYNPPYYKELFESYGFKDYYNQFYYDMPVDNPLPQRFPERHAKFKNKAGYEARHINIKNIEKHAEEFATVYNAAWAQHGENKEITKEQALKLFKKMKPIIDEKMVWFAYYNEEPIAMWINLPDLNQYFKHLHGKFGWLQKLKFLWLKKTIKPVDFTGIAFGVVPKFQVLGVDSFMIYECAMLIQNKGWYGRYEMGWAGDWNPKMINIYKSLGASQSRRLITFRYIFDETKHPFERHPELLYTK